jgi:phospholipid/cholesterol/gamma-HCH transport system permease protein
LFGFLIGLVMALEGARPLRNLGAEIFLADIIGFASFRSTGPLVTAIMLAGRSGSAFAAELGTMKVNEELDALTTMGLNPIRFLALQRVIAAVFLTPVLSMYATAMAVLGGITVMRFLGFPPLMIFHQIMARVTLYDVVLGIEKSVVFGIIIGGVGCLRGLQTREGPRAVGASTTSSVVTSVILIVVANTIFSALAYYLKK